jgi:hypothetical protein
MKLQDLQQEYQFNTANLLTEVSKACINKFIAQFQRDFNLKYSKKYLHYYEWMARSFRCSKHMIGATIFYCESEYLGNGSLSNITAYTMYYSLHHAVSAFLVLLPHISYDNLVCISHKNCLTRAKTELSDKGIAPVGLQELYNYLLKMREIFSYRIPLGCFQNQPLTSENEENFKRYKSIIPVILQLTNIMSYCLYKLSENLFAEIEDEYESLQSQCDKIFFEVIGIKDRLDKCEEFDKEDYRRFGWIVNTYKMPYPQNWLLTEKLCEDMEISWWEKNNDADFDISAISEQFSQWLE